LYLRVSERLISLSCFKLLAFAGQAANAADGEQATQAKWLSEQLGPQFADLAGVSEVNFILKQSVWEATPKPDGNKLRRILAGLDFHKIPCVTEKIAAGAPGWMDITTRLQVPTLAHTSAHSHTHTHTHTQNAVDDFTNLYNCVNRPYPFRDPEVEQKKTKKKKKNNKTKAKAEHAWETPLTAEEFQIAVQSWVDELTLEVDGEPGLFEYGKLVTPYVHTLMCHVGPLLALHEDLHEFGGQEFEKLLTTTIPSCTTAARTAAVTKALAPSSSHHFEHLPTGSGPNSPTTVHITPVLTSFKAARRSRTTFAMRTG